MKFLFLSLVFMISTVGYSRETITLSAKLNNELASTGTLFESQGFEDFFLSDFSGDSNSLTAGKLQYKKIIEELANNQVHSPEGKAFTQLEANLLVKYFLELKIKPDTLLSIGYHGKLKIPHDKDKAQAIQTIENIANIRKDLAQFNDDLDVRCFYRNYKDSNTPTEDVDFTYEQKQLPIADIFRRIDDVTIVGKCRGCGLLNYYTEKMSMPVELKQKFESCNSN